MIVWKSVCAFVVCLECYVYVIKWIRLCIFCGDV